MASEFPTLLASMFTHMTFKFESVSELPVRYAAAFDYEHRYAEHDYEHEHEHENAGKGGLLVE